jgi:carboxymethylenebutenolidase
MRLCLLAPVLIATLAVPPAHAADDHADHAHAAPAAHAAHAAEGAGGALTPNRDKRLPAGEEQAAGVLETSPRHGEYVDIALPGGGTPLRTWVVYPEKSGKAGTVLIIHEIYGLSPWLRALADQTARDGYIAVVPDLISGMGPGGGGTDSTKSRDELVGLIRALTPDMVRTRLDAAMEWAVRQPAANGKVATMGFCWGGSRSFEYAASQPALKAAVVYYGSSPDSATLLQVKAPVLGLYGGDDARVNATIEPARKALKARGRSYEPVTYAGAGHGFLRQQSGREGANLKASQQAWPKTLAFLAKHLK